MNPEERIKVARLHQNRNAEERRKPRHWPKTTTLVELGQWELRIDARS
jgi:hypothetical protein